MIKHSLYAAPLLLMVLSVVCQAQALTKRFVVELEQKTVSPNQSVFITPDQYTLSGTLPDIAHTKGYTESDLTPDEKQGRLIACELKTTIIESISWPWLYAKYLLMSYELILATKNTSQCGGFRVHMAEDVLNNPKTETFLKKVGGKAVSQRMYADFLVNPAFFD